MIETNYLLCTMCVLILWSLSAPVEMYSREIPHKQWSHTHTTQKVPGISFKIQQNCCLFTLNFHNSFIYIIYIELGCGRWRCSHRCTENIGNSLNLEAANNLSSHCFSCPYPVTWVNRGQRRNCVAFHLLIFWWQVMCMCVHYKFL